MNRAYSVETFEPPLWRRTASPTLLVWLKRCHVKPLRELGLDERWRRRGEGATPRTSENHPFVDVQMLSQVLHVGDEVCGGVVHQVGIWS